MDRPKGRNHVFFLAVANLPDLPRTGGLGDSQAAETCQAPSGVEDAQELRVGVFGAKESTRHPTVASPTASDSASSKLRIGRRPAADAHHRSDAPGFVAPMQVSLALLPPGRRSLGHWTEGPNDAPLREPLARNRGPESTFTQRDDGRRDLRRSINVGPGRHPCSPGFDMFSIRRVSPLDELTPHGPRRRPARPRDSARGMGAGRGSNITDGWLVNNQAAERLPTTSVSSTSMTPIPARGATQRRFLAQGGACRSPSSTTTLELVPQKDADRRAIQGRRNRQRPDRRRLGLRKTPTARQLHLRGDARLRRRPAHRHRQRQGRLWIESASKPVLNEDFVAKIGRPT